MQAAKKNPHAPRPIAKSSLPQSRPWGQAVLRHEALRLLKEGKLAPSVIFGNLLAASASPILDAELLSAQPRVLPTEAVRVVAEVLRRQRLPGADMSALLDELMGIAWRQKSPRTVDTSPQRGAKNAKAKTHASPARQKTSSAASSPKPPVIVRVAARLPNTPD